MRILFAGGGTGGHLYPGLAIARALVRLDANVQPFFIGARRGIERSVLPTAGFPYELLELHPLYRTRPWENWRTLGGLASAWRRIGAIAAAAPPSAVVGTGGYAAGAVLAWAASHGVPVAIQEQNSFAGLTVRQFSRWARAVYLGFPEAAASLHPAGRRVAIDTGNPIEPPPAVRPNRRTARGKWGFDSDLGKVLLVFGGSQGARALNDVVARWVDGGLPGGLHLIWGTGAGQFDQYSARASERVRVLPYLSPITDAYAAADLALTRAGAMTTAELCAWAIPSVLVPLPTAAADHQTANARALERAGAALMMPQNELSVERLNGVVQALAENSTRLETLATAAAARARPDAAMIIARDVLALACGRGATA